jgi:hypothetical protein
VRSYEKGVDTNLNRPHTLFMNEAQIKTAARRIAKQANRLRAKGLHAEADAMVDQAMRNVEAMRARGEVVA